MYQAHAASSGWLQLFVITHIWNISNAVIDSHAQKCLILISLNSFAIDGECEAGLSNIIPHHHGLRFLNYWIKIISD
jgi:hypothetical protein